MVYGFFANTFGVNEDEVELDLSTFPSLVEFFVRALKSNARPIDPTTNMVTICHEIISYVLQL